MTTFTHFLTRYRAPIALLVVSFGIAIAIGIFPNAAEALHNSTFESCSDDFGYADCSPSEANARAACAAAGGDFSVGYQPQMCEGWVCSSGFYMYFCMVPDAGPTCSSNPTMDGCSCTKSNACNSTSGTYSGGICGAAEPEACKVCSPNMGDSCSSTANACGVAGSGTIDCSGSCDASVPALPGGYGTSCTSAPNSCSMTDSSGTIQCNSTCSSVTPSDSLCSPQADLTAGDPTPSSATAGTAQTFSVPLYNNGTGSSGSGFTSLVQKALTILGGGATDVTTFSTSVMGGSSSRNVTFPYTFPLIDAGTTKFLRVCADKSSAGDVFGSITETNDGNNCGNWSPVTVASAGGGASIASCTPSVGTASVGQNVTWTITTSGFVPAPTSYSWTATGGTPSSGSGASSSFVTKFGATGNYAPTVTATNGTQSAGPQSCTPVTVTSGGCTNTGPVSIMANPNRIKSGETTVLTWTGSNVSSACSITGPGVSQSSTPSSCSLSGSLTTPALSTQSIYTLSCPGGQTAQAIVNIISTIRED